MPLRANSDYFDVQTKWFFGFEIFYAPTSDMLAENGHVCLFFHFLNKPRLFKIHRTRQTQFNTFWVYYSVIVGFNVPLSFKRLFYCLQTVFKKSICCRRFSIFYRYLIISFKKTCFKDAPDFDALDQKSK